jgi:hypothetical protein
VWLLTAFVRGTVVMMPTPEVPSLPAASYPRGLVVVLGVADSLVALLAQPRR